MCCNFRGSESAVDAATRKVIWKRYMIADPAEPGAKTKHGAATAGPSGAGVWSAATLDPEHDTLFIGTGDNYSDPVSSMSDARGADSILSSKVKLGADASAAPGPKGRTAVADTDIVMRAEILTYSRSRGLFAGVSRKGSTLRAGGSANKQLFGRDLSAREIVREGKVGIPAAGRELVSLLDLKSPKNESDPASWKE